METESGNMRWQAEILGGFLSTGDRPGLGIRWQRMLRPREKIFEAGYQSGSSEFLAAGSNNRIVTFWRFRPFQPVENVTVALAAFSGLRKSEIQGLRWEDLRGNELHVQRTAWRPTQVVEQTKTPASNASVPVLPLLGKHLEAHRNGFPASGFIFTGAKMGRPLDLHNLANRVVRPALRKAGIEWCGWHGFRRGLSTNLKTLGVDDLVIQRILRHANVGVTRQSYIKIEDRVKAAAMKKLQGSLSAKIKARKNEGKRARRRKK